MASLKGHWLTWKSWHSVLLNLSKACFFKQNTSSNANIHISGQMDDFGKQEPEQAQLIVLLSWTDKIKK